MMGPVIIELTTELASKADETAGENITDTNIFTSETKGNDEFRTDIMEVKTLHTHRNHHPRDHPFPRPSSIVLLICTGCPTVGGTLMYILPLASVGVSAVSRTQPPSPSSSPPPASSPLDTRRVWPGGRLFWLKLFLLLHHW